MKKIQHEKINVLKPCLQLCKSLEADGCIIYYRRMDESDKGHVWGDADIRIELVKDCTLWLILCECKRDDGKGRLRDTQKNFKKRYDDCHNVVYLVVENRLELSKFIEKLTGFHKNKLYSIAF